MVREDVVTGSKKGNMYCFTEDVWPDKKGHLGSYTRNEVTDRRQCVTMWKLTCSREQSKGNFCEAAQGPQKFGGQLPCPACW